MDKSGGVGLNESIIRQEVEDKGITSHNDKAHTEAKFNNKEVKPCEGARTKGVVAPEYIEDSNQNKKRIGQHYAISPKVTKQVSPLQHASQTTSEITEIDRGVCYFVDHSSKQKIIEKFRENQEPLTTICISSLEDLEKHGLLQETWLEGGQLKKSEGRLFLEKPLTLIFDLTVMEPRDIASFNDMLQVNPSCNGKPLGSKIKRVCLINNEMIKGTQASNPDLWRRLNRMTENQVSHTDQIQHVLNDNALLDKITTDVIEADKEVVVIDFTLSDNWQNLLFGKIHFDDKGRFIFSDGALSNLSNNVHLVFKNAPWDSPRFKQAIATVLREGCFEANHKRVQFPNNITLSRKDTLEEELLDLKNKKIQNNSVFNPKEKTVCLNSETIENLKDSTRIEGNKIIQTKPLECLIKDCRQLVITSSLDEKQWLWLLTQLDAISEDKKQPLLFTGLSPSSIVASSSPHWRIDNNIEDSMRELENSKYIHYDINASDSLTSFCQVEVISEKKFLFSLNDSPLLQSLKNGELVILSGLEKNPKFAASIETLLLPDPYLFINGHKIDLPNAKVTLLKPNKGLMLGSQLLNHAINQYPDNQKIFVNPIYTLLKALPRSFGKNYPVAPPWDEGVFQHQFEEQAQQESELDGCNEVKPCHKRRALHILLAKAYRGDANVYGYIKAKIAQFYPDVPENKSGDRAALRQWLVKHPNPDAKSIKTHFWELAQHCPTNVHKKLKGYHEADDAVTKRVIAYLVSAASDSTGQPSWAEKFNVTQNIVKQHSFFNGTLCSTLRDTLVANKHVLKDGVIISDAVMALENDIGQILQGTESDEAKIDSIKNRLEKEFKNDQLSQHYEDVPKALLTNQRHNYAQQERRLLHLTKRVQKHPIVFLQGEAGAGKTFMAQAIAERAGFDKKCQIIPLSPNHTAEMLFGGSKLITRTKDGIADQVSQFEEGPILKWAKLKNPPLLVLDEANLTPEGLLAPLAGLTKQPPVICYQGQVYHLSRKHRIILTGNPDYYEGRHFDNTLASFVPTLFYHPLPESVLANSIIKPGLPKQWSDERKKQACERLLVLFNQFKALVPGDLTTPRDIKDVLATVRQILKYHITEDTLSEKQINALIHRAFMDSLSGVVTEEQKQNFDALNTWYQQQFPEDNAVFKGVDQAFGKFLKQLKKNSSDANLNPLPIQKLAYRYWQSLDKDDSGRVASVVEGPAGWGKDYILERVLEQWQKDLSEQKWALTPFVHINANTNQWSSLVDKVKEGMEKGQVIAISELNLIPSNYLEGLFNDVLTGHAKPGFRLFATVNPGSFEGRESMSPALKSRCTQIKLERLSKQELEFMVMKIHYKRDEQRQWLAKHFHQLSEALNAQKSPVQLTLDDLYSTASYLSHHFPDQWSDAFKKHLSFAFRSLKTPLPLMHNDDLDLKAQKKLEERRIECERIANSVRGLETPVTIRLGENFSYHNRKITFPYNITDKDIPNTVYALSNVNNACDRITKDIIREKPVNRLKKGTEVHFDDILTPILYEIKCYFPKDLYDNRNYRIKLFETVLDEDEGLCNYPIHWKDGDIDLIADAAVRLPWKDNLKNGELPGEISLILNNQWCSLPGITHKDELKGIRLTPAVDFEVARSQITGQLLVRTRHNSALQVNIKYIIAPAKNYFYEIRKKEKPLINVGLCNQRLHNLIYNNIICDNENTCKSFEELREIDSIEDVSKRLRSMQAWLNTFSDNDNLTGEGEELLLNIIKEKQGVCRHKSMIFQLFCNYWGIPARQVGSESHSFAEISLDGGSTWRLYEISGGGNNSERTTEPNWNEYQRPPDSNQSFFKSAVFRNDILTPTRSLLLKTFGKLKSVLKNKSPITQDILDELKVNIDKVIKENESDEYHPPFDFYYNSALLLNPKFIESIDQEKDWLFRINKIIEMGLFTLRNRHEEVDMIAAIYRGIGGVDRPRFHDDLWVNDDFMEDPLIYSAPSYSSSDYILPNSEELTLSRKSHSKYINWLCSLCEINEDLKEKILGNLQRRAETLHDFPCADRILKMVREYSFPELKSHDFNNITGKDSQEKYCEWLCNLISFHASFRIDVGFTEMIISELQYLVNNVYLSRPIKEKVEEILSVDYISHLKSTSHSPDDIPSFESVNNFFREMPKSKYLATKASKMKLVTELTSMPRANSRFMPENMARGLPAFVTHSTLKESKPVIIDMCYLGRKFDEEIKEYIMKKAVINQGSDIVNVITPDILEDFMNTYFSVIMTAFLTWLGQQQLEIGADCTWFWLTNDYKSYCEQTEASLKTGYFKNLFFNELASEAYGNRIPVNMPSDMIKQKLKENTGVVITENDLCIMLSEFLNNY